MRFFLKLDTSRPLTSVIVAGGFIANIQAIAKAPNPQVLSHGFDRASRQLASPQWDEPSSEIDSLDLTTLAPTAASEDRLQQIIRQRSMDPSIELSRHNETGLNLFQQRAVYSDAFTFKVDGIDVCLHEIKSHQSLSGRHLILGNLPEVDQDNYQPGPWPSYDDTFMMVSESLSLASFSTESVLLSKNKCLWVSDSKSLIPVWDFRIKSEEIEYRIFADESTIYDSTRLAFHLDGNASVYPSNPLDITRENFSLTGLVGNGRLENDFFKIEVDPYSGNSLALASNHQFIFDINSPHFVQTSLFTNANRMLTWLKQKGFSTFGNQKIVIKAHRVFNPGAFENLNNATYEPLSSGPVISVGDGDGSILKNLGLDADVVNHELGHHVIYQSIDYLSGESLVVHEALADFFVFARSKDSCLGESICPEDSGACAVRAQCLRTADNSLRLDSKNLPLQAHVRSQFFSGFLWDLTEKV